MKKSSRVIVIAYVNLQSGRVEFLIKKQLLHTGRKPATEFLVIKPEERERLGLNSIEYFLNYYEDDVAYVWPNYHAHIASLHQHEEVLKQILINELSYRVATDLTMEQDALHLCGLRSQLFDDNREAFEQVEEAPEAELLKASRYEAVYLFVRPYKLQMQLCRIEQPWPLLDRNMFQLRFSRKMPKVRSIIPKDRDSPEVYFTNSFRLRGKALLSHFLDEISTGNSDRQAAHWEQLQWLRQVYRTIRTNCA